MKATEVAKFDSEKSKKVGDETWERPSELNEIANQNQLKTIAAAEKIQTTRSNRPLMNMCISNQLKYFY